MRKRPSEIVFHGFTLDRRRQQLRRGAEIVRLRPKTWEVLAYLIERPGEIVSKDELLSAVWRDVTVNEHMVQISINELRKALGDDARHPRSVETVHRRGFRWIAALTETAPDSAPDEVSVVGREREMAHLEQSWQRTLTGRRQVVFLTGEAGIGKTTLVDSFLAARSALGEATPWIGRGQCTAQSGSSEAFLPVFESLTSLCDDPAFVATLMRHAPGWLVQIPSALGTTEREALRRDSAGIPAAQSLRLLAEAVEAAANQRPLLIVLEDIHWSDHPTIDLIGLLAERTGPARLMIIATYRPVDAIVLHHPLRERVRALRARHLAGELPLPLLSEGAIRELVERRFPGAGFANDLTQWLQECTGGQPLFLFNLLEELVQQDGIIHDGAGWRLTMNLASRVVPASSQLLVRDQYERLPEQDRALLSAASIAGTEASAAAMAAILGDELVPTERRAAELAARGDFLVPKGDARTPDGTVSGAYSFVHALHREVIYKQIPPADAARMHLRHATWLSHSYAGVLDRIAEPLALHYELGGDYQQAVIHLRAAAARSTERSAPANAASLLARALQLLARDGRREDDLDVILLHIELARALQEAKGIDDPEGNEVFAKACALTASAPESPLLVLALGGCAYLYFVRARFADAEAIGRRAFTLAESMQVPLVSFHANASLAAILRRTGALTEAKQLFERALSIEGELLREMRPDMRTVTLGAYAQTLLLLGYPEKAREAGRRAIERAQSSGFVYDRIWAQFQSAEIAVYLGVPADARTHAGAAVALADAHGFPFWSTAARGILGWAQIQEGNFEAGLRAAREGAELCRTYDLVMQYTVSLLHWATCLLAANQLDECEAVIAKALDLVEANGDRMVEPELWRLRAEATARSARGDAERAASFVQRAIETARHQRSRWWEMRALTSWAAICTPSHEHIEKELGPIVASFADATESPILQDARARLANRISD